MNSLALFFILFHNVGGIFHFKFFVKANFILYICVVNIINLTKAFGELFRQNGGIDMDIFNLVLASVLLLADIVLGIYLTNKVEQKFKDF